jgi:hypothetical protein
MVNTAEELKQFDESKFSEDLKKVYETSLERYKKIEPFEVDLVRFFWLFFK